MPPAPAQVFAGPANTQVALTSPNMEWTQTSQPTAGTQASAVRGAAAGVRHVCTGLIVSALVTTALAAGATLTVNLRDGPSGTGTIIATFQMGLPGTAAVGTVDRIALSGLAIFNTVGNALVLEFAAGVASVVESVTLIGYDSY